MAYPVKAGLTILAVLAVYVGVLVAQAHGLVPIPSCEVAHHIPLPLLCR